MSAALLAFGLGTTELVILLVIVVLVFGVGKLGDVGKELGRGIKNFKEEVGNDGETAQKSLEDQSAEQVAPRDVTDEHRVG